MVSAHTHEITHLLTRLRAGDQEAAERVFRLVYQELRRMAQQQMKRESDRHTLSATALVHEVYLRLFGEEPVAFDNRAHFFAIAGRQMRRILVEHARRKHAAKRDGDWRRLSLDELAAATEARDDELLALDQALERFERLYPRAARVVELRFFCGLTEVETAELLGISLTTLKREWGFAKVWLFDQLKST